MNKKIEVYICTHKKVKYLKNKIYKLLLCGASFNHINEENILKDNIGENISEKNKNYSELTGLYWLWKNRDIDYIGICHYRRYFLFDNPKIKYSFNKINKLNYNEEKIKENLEKYDFILPSVCKCSISLKEEYKKDHRIEDLELVEKILLEKYTNKIEQNKIKNYLLSCEFYPLNMMITKKEKFDDYCKWLFDILFELEKKIEVPKDPYQARIFGFLSERLLGIYILLNNYRVMEEEIIFIRENYFKRLKVRIKNSIIKKLKNKGLIK